MTAVLNSIDGGGSPGIHRTSQRRARHPGDAVADRCRSFYLVGDDLVLTAPTTGFVAIEGMATIGTISDGAGNIIIDEMTVGVDTTEDEIHDYEIVLDDTALLAWQTGDDRLRNDRAWLMATVNDSKPVDLRVDAVFGEPVVLKPMMDRAGGYRASVA